MSRGINVEPVVLFVAANVELAFWVLFFFQLLIEIIYFLYNPSVFSLT